MSQKLSDQQLFNLRNYIPIAAVITDLLRVSAKINCGTLRFRCPVCTQCNTAINDRTNLARCFDCQKNFNPIDMVMAARKINFVQAVRLLKAYAHHPLTQPPEQSNPNQNTSAPVHPPPASKPLEKSSSKPMPIADILMDWVQKVPQPPSKQQDLFSTITEHIADLQRAIAHLSDQLNQFEVIIGNLRGKP
jgi:hypothetical protein